MLATATIVARLLLTKHGTSPLHPFADQKAAPRCEVSMSVRLSPSTSSLTNERLEVSEVRPIRNGATVYSSRSTSVQVPIEPALPQEGTNRGLLETNKPLVAAAGAPRGGGVRRGGAVAERKDQLLHIWMRQ